MAVLGATIGSAPTASAALTERTVPGDYPSIQAAIDAAAPGDTIIVQPGLYRESLRFRGKAVWVRSSGGAAATTIQATTRATVDIGPGGALVGFTVTGGFDAFGAGMAVHGAGTVVAQNVFRGSVQSGGGFGAAIGGNGSSPVIKRNLFENNSCDAQFLSGVVAFVNESSPKIFNNVFRNNPCRAVNMTLPVPSAPSVLNNTMVGTSSSTTDVDGDGVVDLLLRFSIARLVDQNALSAETTELALTDARSEDNRSRVRLTSGCVVSTRLRRSGWRRTHEVLHSRRSRYQCSSGLSSNSMIFGAS